MNKFMFFMAYLSLFLNSYFLYAENGSKLLMGKVRSDKCKNFEQEDVQAWAQSGQKNNELRIRYVTSHKCEYNAKVTNLTNKNESKHDYELELNKNADVAAGSYEYIISFTGSQIHKKNKKYKLLEKNKKYHYKVEIFCEHEIYESKNFELHILPINNSIYSRSNERPITYTLFPAIFTGKKYINENNYGEIYTVRYSQNITELHQEEKLFGVGAQVAGNPYVATQFVNTASPYKHAFLGEYGVQFFSKTGKNTQKSEHHSMAYSWQIPFSKVGHIYQQILRVEIPIDKWQIDKCGEIEKIDNDVLVENHESYGMLITEKDEIKDAHLLRRKLNRIRPPREWHSYKN